MTQNYDKLIKKMTWAMCIALCVQRLSMSAGSVFWGIAILICLYLLYHNRNGIFVEDGFKGYYRAFAIFFITLLPSLCFAGNFFTWIKNFAEMWLYRPLPFFMVTLFIRDRELLNKVLMIFISVTAVDCTVALYQAIALYARGWGFGGGQLQLASLLCILMPAVVVILLDDEFSSRAKLVAKIALPFLFAGMLAGRSRGLWLALVIVLPLVMWRYLIKNRKALMVTVLIVAALCGFFAAQPKFVERVKSITNITTDISNRDRIVIWRSAKNMIKDHPLTGVGLGQFKKNYFAKYQLREIKQRHLNHTHNNVLQICAETGILGALGFIYLSIYILIRNFREWLRRKDPYSLIIWGSWLAFIIFGIFDVIIDHSAVTKSWWFLLGTMLVMKNGKSYENDLKQ